MTLGIFETRQNRSRSQILRSFCCSVLCCGCDFLESVLVVLNCVVFSYGIEFCCGESWLQLPVVLLVGFGSSLS